MKHKKLLLTLIVFILTMFGVYGVYTLFSNQNRKINYIPLGDSVAEGMNAYSVVDYGYTDFIADDLRGRDKLEFYTKGFTKSGYTTDDVKEDIENNKMIEVDGKKIYLKEALRESDLVTLTIGANNFLGGLSYSNIGEKILNIKKTKKEADEIAKDVKELIILIKKYAKNQIIVTGYYNPFPRLTQFKDNIDEIIKYYNNEIEEICEELDVTYVDIFDIFDGNNEGLPNPLNIHPSKNGYELIAKEILKEID